MTFDVRRFMERAEWFADAECRGLDPDMFFPVENLQKPAGARILAQAREICRRCDVQAECLAYALNGRETGIWAGTTDSQRRKIHREQSAATSGHRSYRDYRRSKGWPG